MTRVKKRLDVLLVERGLVDSRARAQALVMAGRVPGYDKPGQQVDEDELKAFVKERLAPYKYPRFLEFVSELPKTATGKIQRFRLREKERQA